MRQPPTFILKWRRAVYERFLTGKSIKTLIVNQKDLESYEDWIASLNQGVIPTFNGVLTYKNVPLGISEQLQPGECAVEE
jgi:hypothetical protein